MEAAGAARSAVARGSLSQQQQNVMEKKTQPANDEQQQSSAGRAPSVESQQPNVGKRQLLDAIELLPMGRKSAYLEAVKRAPHLVETETDPLKFLRCCDYNVWAAAERLVCYWQERRSMFGDSRAFRPMTQSGDGALSPDDLVALHAGFFVLLPPSSSPSGRSVVFVDRTKALASASADVRLRCFMYLFTVISEDERSQVDGILFLVLFITPRVIDFDHVFVQKAVRLMTCAFPVKLDIHLLNCLPKTGKRAMVNSLISTVSGYLAERHGFTTHIEESKGGMLDLLKGFGLDPSGLPASVGGTWRYEKFLQWCRNRVIQEREKERSALSPQGPAVASSMSTNRENPNDHTPPEAKKARKRKLNVIHSRQKRERRKSEYDSLQKESQALTCEQSCLKAENLRLLGLLEEANAMITSVDLAVVNAPVVAQVRQAAGTAGSTSASMSSRSILPDPSAAANPLRMGNLMMEGHATLGPPAPFPADAAAAMPPSGSASLDETARGLLNQPVEQQLSLMVMMLQNNPELSTILGLNNTPPLQQRIRQQGQASLHPSPQQLPDYLQVQQLFGGGGGSGSTSSSRGVIQQDMATMTGLSSPLAASFPPPTAQLTYGSGTRSLPLGYLQQQPMRPSLQQLQQQLRNAPTIAMAHRLELFSAPSTTGSTVADDAEQRQLLALLQQDPEAARLFLSLSRNRQGG